MNSLFDFPMPAFSLKHVTNHLCDVAPSIFAVVVVTVTVVVTATVVVVV